MKVDFYQLIAFCFYGKNQIGAAVMFAKTIQIPSHILGVFGGYKGMRFFFFNQTIGTHRKFE
jgi:hypothetical protein